MSVSKLQSPLSAKNSNFSNPSNYEFRAQGIAINLLPKEILLDRLQSSKLRVINKLSFLILILLIFFTSATLALRISQNSELEIIQAGLVSAQSKVTSLQGKEVRVMLLKQRLKSIQSLSGTDHKIKDIFNLVSYIVQTEAPLVEISDFTIDKNGNMQLAIKTSSLSDLEKFFASLGDTNKNAGLVSKVELSGLSYVKGAIYQVDMRIIQK